MDSEPHFDKAQSDLVPCLATAQDGIGSDPVSLCYTSWQTRTLISFWESSALLPSTRAPRRQETVLSPSLKAEAVCS